MSDRDREFSEFVRGSWTPLLRVATAMTGDVRAGENLLQTTLVSVYARWRKASIDSPNSYTRAALLRAFSSRRRAWRHEIPSGHRIDRGSAPDPSAATDERAAVTAVLRTLPPHQRAVLVLRFLEDLSVEDVASILGCSPGTVRSRTNRALSTLRASGALRLVDNSGKETVGE